MKNLNQLILMLTVLISSQKSLSTGKTTRKEETQSNCARLASYLSLQESIKRGVTNPLFESKETHSAFIACKMGTPIVKANNETNCKIFMEKVKKNPPTLDTLLNEGIVFTGKREKKR